MAETGNTAESGSQPENPYLLYFLAFWDFLLFICQSTMVVCVSLFRLVVPAPEKSVKGEVVLVTGSGHGLGRLLALNFARLGAKVVLWDVNQEKNLEVAAEITANGGIAHAYRCDVSDEKQVEEVGGRVLREVGEVTVLINNAGVLPGKPIMYLNSYQIKRTLEINTLSHFWTIRQFLPRMIEANHGHIVAVSSAAGILGCANLTDYCASKFGVVGLMASLREDIFAQGKEDNIQLTVVCPATMDTGLVQRPKIRFPTVFPLLKVEAAAKRITHAILTNEMFVVIPPSIHYTYKIIKLFPEKVVVLLTRYLEYTMDPNIQ